MGLTTQSPVKFLLKITLGALLVVLSWGFIAQLAAAAAPGVSAGDRVLICHIPPHGPLWLWVNDSALGGHLDHGDTIWTDGAECGGQLYPSDDDECDDRSISVNSDDKCDDDECDDRSISVNGNDECGDDECDDRSTPLDDDDEECGDDDPYWIHLPVVHAR